MTSSFNDTPISQPDQDRFGFDPLARAIARSIEKVAAPEGTVFALSGPWGSGKSSALNLILHHLRQSPVMPPIQVIPFACWWYRGEDALTLAFLDEIFGALKPSLSEEAQGQLEKLGKRLLKAKDLVGPVVGALGTAAAGALGKGAADTLDKLLSGDEPWTPNSADWPTNYGNSRNGSSWSLMTWIVCCQRKHCKSSGS